jgi:uncharacterized membrane protein YhaH (DUF805 family)
MTAVTVFLIDVGITSGVSLIVVAYLRRPLKAILADLCGTSERAKFWSAISNVTLMLVPLIFAMQYRPELGQDTTVVLEMGTQLKWALVGLVVSVVTLGIVIRSFIPRGRPATSTPQERLL